MSSIRRIGILTGGGDCPGLNAVIRAVTKTAIFEHGTGVFGIEDGFQGLVENRGRELGQDDVSGILTRGGTILGSNNKYNPSRVYVGDDDGGEPRFEDRIDACLAMVEDRRLDAIVVIGGDGTMSCAAPLVERGIPIVGVPKTIDNDLVGTDITFGFLSAMSVATSALDRLHSTAASHHRVMVCEIMGRNAGWLALGSGVASGADVILIPEIPFRIGPICKFVQERREGGRGFSIVACSEGAAPEGGERVVHHVDPTSPDPVRLGGIGQEVADRIEATTGIETRTTVLGHVQRGGSPVPEDRILASRFGYRALDLLMHGVTGRMVVMREGVLDHVDLLHAANKQRLVPLDHDLIRVARGVRTCFGADV
jgi:6-phosphofructokinase 1